MQRRARRTPIHAPMSPRPISLAGKELRDSRHVCALVEGPFDAHELLKRFIDEGFEQGDRAYHVVDPQLRDKHIERLRASGIDVSAAMASGQLAVDTWSSSYLEGGRFSRRAQLAYMRRHLEEGPRLGFPVTRYIGTMEWAVDARTVRDLLAYEATLDETMTNLPGVIICSYDLNHHSARTIADVLGVHALALVGGELRDSRSGGHLSARDRLLAAAAQRFQEAGIQATGVDSIVAAAGVAKATFYRHFPSKDDLVVAWLSHRDTKWFGRVRWLATKRASTPADVIPLVFDAAGEWFEADGFRGCPYLNAAVEITDQSHPALPVIREYLASVDRELGELAAAAGQPDPQSSGQQVGVLLSGAIGQAVALHSSTPFEVGRNAATRVLGGSAPGRQGSARNR